MQQHVVSTTCCERTTRTTRCERNVFCTLLTYELTADPLRWQASLATQMNAMHAMLDTSAESTIVFDSAKNQDAQKQLYNASTGLKGHLGSNTVRVLQLNMHQGTV